MNTGSPLSVGMTDPLEVQKVVSDLQKAISSTAVTGLMLVREDLQDEMALALPTDTPIRNRLRRFPGNGDAHAWYQLTATVHAEGRFAGTGPHAGFFAAGGLPTAVQASYRYMSAPYVSLGDIAQVTFFAQMAGKSYADNKARQVKMKMLNVGLMEEWAIINGNSTYDTGLEFDGFNRLITTNTTDMANAPITLSAVSTTARLVANLGGKPQFLVFSFRDKQNFSELVLTGYYRLFQQQGGGLADVPSGISVNRWICDFGIIDIIGSRFIYPATGYTSNNAYLIDDATITDDGNAVAMVDLMPVSSIDLAIVNTSYRTLVAEFSVLMMTVEVFQAKIINIGA